MTTDLYVLRMPEGGWLVKCVQYPSWRFQAESYDELRAKAQASLHRHRLEHDKVRWHGWDPEKVA